MATILVAEPHPEARALIARVVARVGHEPWTDPAAPGLEGIDVAIVEPDHAAGLAAAEAAAAAGVPTIVVSILAPADAALPAAPVAHLVKPFSLRELEDAILDAVALGRRPGP